MTYSLRTYLVSSVALFFIVFPYMSYADDPPPTTGGTAGAVESAAAPYAFKSQGLFGCNLNGAYAMSIGTMSAIGGVYVPVNDAAVTLNTGILVYKECVLREVVDAERMSALAAIQKNALTEFDQGTGGRGAYPKVLGKDELDLASDPAALDFLQNKLGTIPATLRGPIQRALVQNYLAQTRSPSNAYTCPYAGDMQAVWSGQDKSPAALLASIDPKCDPLFAYNFAKEARDTAVSRCLSEMLTRLQWNNGIYDVTEGDKICDGVVTTPGTLRRDVASAAVLSGQRQMETANDLGQMVSALYTAMGTRIGSTGGLTSMLQSVGGQPSYLDQVVAEQSANVRSAAVNAAIQVLAAARQIEGSFLQIATNITNILTQTVQQLRSMENQCWGFVIQKVCTAPPAANGTCTSPNGDQLRVATSTAFSQAIVSAQITPLATPAINNVTAAQSAVTLIDQLISSVTNTNSLDAQRLALQQLDTLVAQHKIHNQYDLQSAQSQQAAVQQTMSDLINKTKTDWGDSMDTNVGWCNVNNQAVVDMWIQRWKQ